MMLRIELCESDLLFDKFKRFSYLEFLSIWMNAGRFSSVKLIDEMIRVSRLFRA